MKAFRRPSMLLAAALWCGTACGDRRSSDVPMAASVLVPAGVDTLPESAEEFVGRVRSVTVDASGTVFVSDQSSRRIIAFGPGRGDRRVIGAPGDGPGEFNGPVAVARWGHDTLAVTDVVSQSVSLFTGESARFLHRTHVPGLPTSLGASERALFVAAYSLAPSASVATWHAGADTATLWLALPPSVTRHTLAMQAFPISFVAARLDTVAVGFASSNEVIVAADGSAPADQFILPSAGRRQIPEDLDAALAPVLPTPGRLTLIPSLDGMYWRPDGMLEIWHKDWIAPPGGLKDYTRAATQATLHAFVSVVDRVRRRACVDIPVATDWAENPALAANGDMFYVVGHYIDRAAKPVLEMRRFRFDFGRCRWIPIP